MVEKGQKANEKARVPAAQDRERAAATKARTNGTASAEKTTGEARAAVTGTADAVTDKAGVKTRAKEHAAEQGRALRGKGSQLKDQTGQVAGSALKAVPDGPQRVAKRTIRLVRLQPKKIAAAGAVAVTVTVWTVARRRRH